MSRVDLATAAEICGVQPGTIRRWVFDGRIKRHYNGYDYEELLSVKDGRSMGALMSRAGIKMADRPKDDCS